MAQCVKKISLKLPLSATMVFRDNNFFTKNVLSDRGVAEMRCKIDNYLLRKELDKFTKQITNIQKKNAKKYDFPLLTKIHFNKPSFLFSPQNKKKLNFFGKEHKNNLFEKKSGKTQVSLITPKLSRQNSGATFFNCTNRSERQFLVLSPIISGINEKKKKFVRNRINKSKSVSNMFENAFIKQQMQLNEKNK